MPLSDYPAALTAFPTIGPNTREDDPATHHDEVHERVHESLRALEELVGTDDGAGGLTGLLLTLAGLLGDVEDLDDRVSDLEEAPGGAIARPITAAFDGGAIDGTPESIRVGQKAQIRLPFAVTLTAWTLLLQDATGDCTIEVRTKPFASGSFTAITGGAAPAATSGANATGGVTGWTTVISAGDLLEFEVTARSGLVPRATLILEATQS